MPKIQFKGLFRCTTRRGCPQSNEIPHGCPLWRDEDWENEDLQIKRLRGCGFEVDPLREQWTAGRAFLAAQTAQHMRNEQVTVITKFNQFFRAVKQLPVFKDVDLLSEETKDERG